MRQGGKSLPCHHKLRTEWVKLLANTISCPETLCDWMKENGLLTWPSLMLWSSRRSTDGESRTGELLRSGQERPRSPQSSLIFKAAAAHWQKPVISEERLAMTFTLCDWRLLSDKTAWKSTDYTSVLISLAGLILHWDLIGAHHNPLTTYNMRCKKSQMTTKDHYYIGKTKKE